MEKSNKRPISFRETRNSLKIRPLDFEKKCFAKYELQNTNERTCDYLRDVTLLICYAEALLYFDG